MKTRNRFVLFALSSLCIFMGSCRVDEERDLIFLGDSIVERWDTDKYFLSYNTCNRGVGGSFISDCIGRGDCRGKEVLILVGTNDISSFDLNDIFFEEKKKEYEALIFNLHAKKSYIISILPRNDNKKLIPYIKKFNIILKDIAKEDSLKSVFIDVFDEMGGDNGLPLNFTHDGLHLSQYGYDKLSGIILSKME